MAAYPPGGADRIADAYLALTITVGALLAVTAVAAALVLAGVAGFRRRDAGC
ncbi:hypothetical protein AB0G04_04825 [Actinoplanes sp. NPDC023801]|uniref:hypothetical protein n=1 Tax=Actinoplanes sp. NPDC023801 TaxID=3154595 RepID=UPI0033CFB44E